MRSDPCHGQRPPSSPQTHREQDAGAAHREDCGPPVAGVMLSIMSQQHRSAPSTVTTRGPPARVPGGRGWGGMEVSRGHLDSVAADLGEQLRRRGQQQDLGCAGGGRPVPCPGKAPQPAGAAGGHGPPPGRLRPRALLPTACGALGHACGRRRARSTAPLHGSAAARLGLVVRSEFDGVG